MILNDETKHFGIGSRKKCQNLFNGPKLFVFRFLHKFTKKFCQILQVTPIKFFQIFNDRIQRQEIDSARFFLGLFGYSLINSVWFDFDFIKTLKTSRETNFHCSETDSHKTMSGGSIHSEHNDK